MKIGHNLDPLGKNHTPAASQTIFPAVTIHTRRFQPFSSRQGVDEVMGVSFPYDARLVARLKALLAVYGVGHKYKTAGGWLAQHRCWFIEVDVWELAKLELLFLGYRIVGGGAR